MAAFCRTTLNYAPANSAGDPVPTEVEVLDGRVGDLPGWAVCGFELLHHASTVRNWDDDDEIASVHYAELEVLARQLAGCDHAIVSGHIKRGREQAARHPDLAPIRFVHSDFASSYSEIIRSSFRRTDRDGSAPATRDGLTAQAVDDARRIVVLQFWRNLGPAKMDLPIGFCDARTVRPDDARTFLVTDYAGAGGPDFEALAVMAPDEPARHKWYAFPMMTSDEVVAFRTYDTDLMRDGKTFFTPHSAFRDPAVPVGEPARLSIELRAVCLFT